MYMDADRAEVVHAIRDAWGEFLLLVLPRWPEVKRWQLMLQDPGEGRRLAFADEGQAYARATYLEAEIITNLRRLDVLWPAMSGVEGDEGRSHQLARLLAVLT